MSVDINELFSLSDEKLKKFNRKLIPNIPAASLLGIRTPELRRIAACEMKNDNGAEFINKLPHEYHEENIIHAIMLGFIGDYDTCIAEIKRFLPYVDNWACCDQLRPKCFKKNLDRLHIDAVEFTKSEHTYTVRFGIECLMLYYLDEKYDKRYSDTVAEIKSDEYYVNMMIAWYFATALSKRYDDAIKYVEQKMLSPFVHRKTIQKAKESRIITNEQKEYLEKLV